MLKGESYMNDILIGIYEESPSDIDLLVQYLRIIETSLGMHFNIRTFSQGTELLNAYDPVYDILFLNLPMADIDAETFISQIRQKDSFVHIILLCESNDYFQIAFKYRVSNVLKKPLSFFKILNELKQCLSDERNFYKPYFLLSTQRGEYKLYLHKLRFIETNNRQLELHYGNELFFYNGNLSDFNSHLTSQYFFRCNNNYIVNVNYIEKIEKDINRYIIFLVTGEKIPLSQCKIKELKELLISTESEIP